MKKYNYKKGSLILLSGLPGSGKSTFSKKHFGNKEGYILSSDKIREDFFGGFMNSFSNNGDLVKTNNHESSGKVFEIMTEIARERCNLGLTTVIDAMNITDNARNQFVKLGKWEEVHTIIFDKNIEQLKENNKTRSNNGGRFVDEYVFEMKDKDFIRTTGIKGNNIINSDNIESFTEINNEIKFENDTKYIVLGDSHGIDKFIENFDKILEENKYNKYKIIINGDVVDRGEKSVENLLYLYEKMKRNKDIIFIAGNHERKLLKNLREFEIEKCNKEITSAAYKTHMELLKVFQEGFNGKKYNIKQIINFLDNLKPYVIINRENKNKKTLISHAPFIPPHDLNNIINEDCYYGIGKLRGYGNKPEDIQNFLKALNKYLEINNMNYIFGHINLEDQINEMYKNNNKVGNIKRMYSIEGGVDHGGDFVKLEMTYYKGIEITKENSGLDYYRNSDNNTLNNKKVFDSMVKRKLITGNNSHSRYKNLYIYKYGREVFYNHLWGKFIKKENEALELSRGLVLDTAGNLVSYPLEKIFNYGEKVEGNDNKLKSGKYEFIEKFNGFLGVISPDPYDNQKLLVHTQGSLDDRDEFPFNRYIRELLSKEQELNLLKLFREKGKHTLAFEVIHKNDPHIVKYEDHEYGLKLIGARDISSNDVKNTKLYNEDELDALGKELGFERPMHFESDLDEVLGNLHKEKNLEGYMIRDIKTKQTLVKLKSPYYLTSKFLGRMSEGNYTFLFANKEKFMESKGIEEEFYPIIDFIYDNKDKFKESDKESRVEMIKHFINDDLNVSKKKEVKNLGGKMKMK